MTTARKKSYGPISGGIDFHELVISQRCPECGNAHGKSLTKGGDYRTANRPQDSRLGAMLRGRALHDSEEEDDAFHDADYDLREGHAGGKQDPLHEGVYRGAEDFVSKEDFDEFARLVLGLLDKDADADADADEEEDNEEKLYDQKGPRGTGGIPQFAAKGLRELGKTVHARLDAIEDQMRARGLSKALSLAKAASPSRGGDADLLEAADRWATSRGRQP